MDMHLHTHHSHDSLNSLEAILQAARTRCIDRLIITDHNRISGALELQALDPERIIIGEEVKTRERADIIGIFMKELIPKGTPARETAMRIRDQGGVVYFPHPFDESRAGNSALLEELEDLVDIVEVHNSRCFPSSLNAKALDWATRKNKLMGGGSDAHTIREIGRGFVELPAFENNRDSFLASMAEGKIAGTVSTSLFYRFASNWAKVRKRLGNPDL